MSSSATVSAILSWATWSMPWRPERAKGARVENAYAFAHHDGTDAGLIGARNSWLAKNINPILYSKEDDHRHLAEALIEWARISNDPFEARSQIALSGINKLPVEPNDPVVERVVWALEDPVAAQTLAAAPAIDDEDEFPKIEQWLEVLQQEGLMRCAAADANLGGQDSAPRIRTAGRQRIAASISLRPGPHAAKPCGLDSAARSRAPVLGWVLRHGGHVHPGLRELIQARLADPEANIPSRLRRLWTVLVNYEPTGPWKFVWTHKHYQAAESESEGTRIEDHIVLSMTPRLIVLPGPSLQVQGRRYVDPTQAPSSGGAVRASQADHRGRELAVSG